MTAEADSLQTARLAALRTYAVLDSVADADVDAITDLVAEICEVPMCLVSLVDTDRQWFLAKTGFCDSETPLSQSICSRVMHEGGLVEIPDTLEDARTRDNTLCQGPDAVRFYAGAPLVTPGGEVLGMLCVLDMRPRRISDLQGRALMTMARQVMGLMEARKAVARLDTLRREIDHRVKNSLASVMASVQLLTRRAKQDETVAALDDIAGKLSAQVALHEELYLSDDMLHVDVARFLQRLARPLATILSARVRIEIDAEPLRSNPRTANLIGLIVNEFVTNADKYAFAEGSAGTVSITGRQNGDSYTITCRDNGQAGPEALAETTGGRGLGMRIIQASLAGLGTTGHWRLAEPGLELRFDLPAPRSEELAPAAESV